MTQYAAPWSPRGIDFDMVRVGEPCIQPRALAVADLIHHQAQRRRITGHAVAYQPGDAELATPNRVGSATIPCHAFRYLVGPNTRFVRVSIWTLGAAGSVGTQFLTVTTTTDGAGVTTGRVVDAAAPGTTVDADVLQVFSVHVEVTPGTLETVTIVQNSVTHTVRILSVIVTELPIAMVDSMADAVYINLDNFEPGTQIVDTENDDLVLGQNLLRRRHKKLLHSDAREAAITDVGVANRRDIGTWVSGNPPAERLQWGIYPSVNLPETATVAVTCVVLGRATAGTGSVQFSFSGGSATVINIGALGLYAVAGTIAKGSDTVSVEPYISVAGTLFVYGYWVYENVEAA